MTQHAQQGQDVAVAAGTRVTDEHGRPRTAQPAVAAGQRGRRWAPAAGRIGISVGSLVVVVAIWQLVGPHVDPIYVSYPSAVARSFVATARSGQLWPAFVATMQPMLLGYAVAVVLGIPLGLVLGRYRTVERILGMYVTAGYATPLVALVPLFVLWFGLNFKVKAWVVFVMAIFPVIINTWSGAKLVPRTLVEVAKSFVAGGPTIMMKIVMPSTLPYIMTGLRLSVGRAVIGVVIAEFYTAIGGLGGIIINAQQRFDTATMMVPILILLVLGVGLTALIGRLEAWVAPWQSALSGRDEEGA